MARLLTWDEVRELRTGDRVFVEDAQDAYIIEPCVVDVDEDADDVALINWEWLRYHAMPEWESDYNRNWRAWDTEPTQQERGNAPEWGTEVI